MLPEKESNYQSYPAENSESYNNDQHVKMGHWYNSGTHVMEVTNQFMNGLKIYATK